MTQTMPSGPRRDWVQRLVQHASPSSRRVSIRHSPTSGIVPYAYLCHLFEEFPKATTAAQLEALLPWNAKIAVAAATTIDDAELVA